MNKSPIVEILEQCIALHDAKSSDYDHPTKRDGLANFRVAAELGIPPYIGALARMSDKWERIKTLTYKMQKLGEGPAVKNETIEDTLQDIIVYGCIVLALYREHIQAQTPTGSVRMCAGCGHTAHAALQCAVNQKGYVCMCRTEYPANSINDAHDAHPNHACT